MSLKETTRELKELLQHITNDLEKAEGGNKAASQRVRTGTVKLEKVSKMYRKQSISSEKGTPAKKPARASASKSSAASKTSTSAKGKGKASTASSSAKSSHSSHNSHNTSHAVGSKNKAKPAGKSSAKASTTSRPLAVNRSTAKNHSRRSSV